MLRTREELKSDWDGQWERFWRPLLLTDGVLDEAKIKNEMADLVFIYEQVSEVYTNLTGERLSNPMYYAEAILSENREALQEEYERGFEDGKEQATIDAECV